MENNFTRYKTDYIRQYQKNGVFESVRMYQRSPNNYPIEEGLQCRQHHNCQKASPWANEGSFGYVLADALKTSYGLMGTVLTDFGPNAGAERYGLMKFILYENVKKMDILPIDADV